MGTVSRSIRKEQIKMVITKVSEDEKYLVQTAMMRHGGSFVSALGSALMHADRINAYLIKKTWPEYWEIYLSLDKEGMSADV